MIGIMGCCDLWYWWR